MDIIRKHWFFFSERFWLDCLEIEVIPLANHKLHWRLNEPIITQTEDAQMLSLGEHLRERHSWFVLPELLLFLSWIFKENTYRRKTQRFQRRMKLSFLSYNQWQKKCKGPGNLSAKKKNLQPEPCAGNQNFLYESAGKLVVCHARFWVDKKATLLNPDLLQELL